jgi:hypothetical protein
MGVVYEAIHSGRRRPEALKVLKGGLGASPDMVARFHREVEAMANVTHDHVVRVYDSGQEGQDLYYTMPLLRGPSLADVVREIRATGESPPGKRAGEVLDRHRVPPAQREGASPEETYCMRVAALLVGPTDALASMHARGILHRDVKPGNLILDDRGRLLVADFGLVRWSDQRITRTGQSLGTPAYMSPEQVITDGSDPDGRADVYALGATLYELLTLRLPHEGDTGLETVRRKLSRRVEPARSLNGRVPEDLETLVGRCLERRREDRFPSALLLREDLERFARGEPVVARPLSRFDRAWNYARRHALPLGVAAAVILAAGAWHLSRPAYLTVATVPPGARVFVDDELIGTTPFWSIAIPSGQHQVRVERERFATFVRPIELTRGSSLELDRLLQAADPADPVALRALTAALGYGVTEVTVATTRSGAGTREPAVLFPRGKLRAAPKTIRMWVDAGHSDLRAVIEPADEKASEPLASLPVAESPDRVDAPVPEDVRARIEPGRSYQVRLVDASGATRDTAPFTVMGDAARETAALTLRKVMGHFESSDPARGFVKVEALLALGLHEEAYEAAVSLREEVGPRREVARAGLAVLEAASLRDRGWWEIWASEYREAER